MALLKLRSNTATAGRAQDVTRETARQLSARSKYLAHLAAAQGYRAAAGTSGALSQTRGYLRRHPMASLGIVAGIASLLGLGMYRRNKQ